MEKELSSLLENKAKLEKLLKECEYLNKTHEDLANTIKESIEKTNKFFDASNGIVEDMAVMRTSAREDMLALNEVMSKQLALVKSVNEAISDLSSKYQISKEEVAKILPLLEKRASLQKEINDMGDVNLLSQSDQGKWLQLSYEIDKVEESIGKMGIAAERMRDDYDANINGVKELCDENRKLKNTTEDVTTAQSKFNESMEAAIKKAESWKKSGWFQALSSGWKLLKNIGKSGTDKWLEIDQASRDFGRNVGMTGEQLEKHTSGIYKNYGSMAKKLGMDFKEIYKFQTGYAEATEKAVILTHEQVTTMASLSRNTGEQAISVASKNLDVFATSADATIEYLAKGTARASLEGLNVKKFSEAFANNIKMASKYTFKEGITGIQKMTLLSQRLKFNMESIGAAMDKFSTIEGAIDAGAKLQVLGGSFAQNFGNPLEAMSEALLDGEAFTKRIIDTVSSHAKFNNKTGEIDLSPIDKQRLKAAASAMGVSYDDLHNMATQSRKSSMIEQVMAGKGLSETQEAYLTNKAQYNKATGKWHLTDASGEMLKKDISQMSKEEIDKARGADSYEKIISSDVSAIHDLIQGKGNSELSKLETIRGIDESIKTNVARLLDLMPTCFQWVVAAIHSSPFIGGAGDIVGDFIGGLGRKGFSKLSRKKGIGGAIGRTKGGRMLRKANVAIRKTSRKLGSLFGGVTNGMSNRIISGSARGASKFGLRASVKGVPVVGNLLDVGLGGLDMYNASKNFGTQKESIIKDNTLSLSEKAQALNDAKKDRNKSYGSSVGSIIGGAIGLIGGPLGAMAGSAIGNWIGTQIGGAVTESVDNTMSEVEKNVSGVAKSESYSPQTSMNEQNIEENTVQVGNIEKIVGNIDKNLGLMGGTMSQAFVNNNINNVNYRIRPNETPQISIADMKLHVGGKIELVSSVSSSGIDMKSLLRNDDFIAGVEKIIQRSMNKQVGGREIQHSLT